MLDLSPWVRSVRPGAPLRLLCLPYAGGGSVDYRRWKDGLLPAVDLLPVVLPGKEHRLGETPPADLRALASQMSAALLPLFTEGPPVVVYGHSMGAWLAFELTRALRRRGVRPAHLVLGARRAPHRPPRQPPLSHLPDELFIERMAARYGAIPDAIRREPDILKLFLPALRSDFQMLDRYEHIEEPPLDLPVTALHGSGDLIEDEGDVRAWSQHTTGPFSARVLPGGHFFLRESVDEVTDLLNTILRPLLPR